MSRAKIKKKSTFIDMTAMSDVTVLLLTFFMLTSTFVKKEPVRVATPASVSEIKIPETNILQILVDTKGKIFMSVDQKYMINILQNMGKEYGVSFSSEQEKMFMLSPTFGVAMNKMKQYLDLSPDEQNLVLKDMGIPSDSIDNQFKAWVRNARSVAKKDLRIAIKADANTPYSVIKTVMNSLQDLKEDRYNLITSLKTESEE
jgi:biopolymer transport protein ExbD